jgi:hypothetical protein
MRRKATKNNVKKLKVMAIERTARWAGCSMGNVAMVF